MYLLPRMNLHWPESYRLVPPDEFQFPPKRVVEQSDQMGRTDPVVPVPDPKMEDLSDTLPYLPNLPGTPPIPPLPPAEARSEDRSELLDQVEFPVDTGSDGWEEWDEYPLGGGQSGDKQSPEHGQEERMQVRRQGDGFDAVEASGEHLKIRWKAWRQALNA